MKLTRKNAPLYIFIGIFLVVLGLLGIGIYYSLSAETGRLMCIAVFLIIATIAVEFLMKPPIVWRKKGARKIRRIKGK